MSNYITLELLQDFASKFAAKVSSLFVRKESGKGLSSNDYTMEEKVKLLGISSGAQVNTIESISVNGNAITVSSGKNVNLEVLVASDLANYYTSAQVDQMVSIIPKFGIEVVDNLPTSNISPTTVYLVPSGDESQNVYTEYIYVNGAWERLGVQTVDLSGYLLKSAGIAGAQAKDATTITFTRGDGTAFDVTIAGVQYVEATQSVAGLMSPGDKVKLDGITEATEADITSIIDGLFV